MNKGARTTRYACPYFNDAPLFVPSPFGGTNERNIQDLSKSLSTIFLMGLSLRHMSLTFVCRFQLLAPHSLNITSYAYLHKETELAQYVRAVEHDWVLEFNAYIGPTSELGWMRTQELYGVCHIGRSTNSRATFDQLGCTPDGEIDFQFCSGCDWLNFDRAFESCGSLC